MVINKRCCICGFTQSDLLKSDRGGMMLAVFPTDKSGKTNGKPMPLCVRCWNKYINNEFPSQYHKISDRHLHGGGE